MSSAQIEQKSHDESDSKQQQAAVHRKPGSLAEKMNVLGQATAESLAPATQWVREKAAAIMNKGDSNGGSHPINVEPAPVAVENEARDEGKWESEGGHPLDERDDALPTSSAVPAAPINSIHAGAVRVSSGHPGVVDALRDVSEHIGESVSHLIEPAVQAFRGLVDPILDGPQQQQAAAPGGALASSQQAPISGSFNSASATSSSVSAPASGLATPSAVNSISASSNASVSSEERAAEKASVAALSKVAGLSQEQKEAEMNKMKKRQQ